MSVKIIRNYWNEIKEKIYQQQGKPTDYEIKFIAEELAEALRKAYNYDKLKTKKAIHKLSRET